MAAASAPGHQSILLDFDMGAPTFCDDVADAVANAKAAFVAALTLLLDVSATAPPAKVLLEPNSRARDESSVAQPQMSLRPGVGVLELAVSVRLVGLVLAAKQMTRVSTTTKVLNMVIEEIQESPLRQLAVC